MLKFELQVYTINMKILFSILIISSTILACNTQEKNSDVPISRDTTIVNKDSINANDEFIVEAPHSVLEKKILEKISLLPEYKRSNAYLDSLTNRKHGLSSMIFKPSKNEKEYYVRVGYNGDDRFETYYNFYVDSTTLAIKIADVLEGDIVSLETWRKRELKRN